MKKSKKVSPTYKRVCKNFFNQHPMAFLFHLTVSFILTMWHVWHWFGCMYMVVLLVVRFSFCCFNFVVLHVLVRCVVQLTEQSNRVKRMKESKGWGASCSIIHNFMSSKCICTGYNTKDKSYRVKKSSIESQHSHHHHHCAINNSAAYC